MNSLRYIAFISYSHADRKPAESLLRKLQSYRLPKGATPQDSRRLGRVFMDRETLPASGDLSDAIKTGLQQSANLIVVCSPAATQSKWVDKEIQIFRQFHPDGQVIAAVIEGEPGAREGADLCFPAALLAMKDDPLAADFRKKGDGPTLGFLKVAASLSGARLSALLQRDSTRQRSRLITGVTLSSIIAISMTALAGLALQARQDADARRAEAEDLVDFMMIDLKDELRPVGKLAIMQGVADKVQSHYGNTSKRLDCEAISRNIQAINLNAEIATSEDELEKAIKISQLGKELSTSHKQQCWGNPAFQLAVAHNAYYSAHPIYGQGVNAWRGDEKEIANEKFQSALEFYEQYDEAIAPLKLLPEQSSVYQQEYADNRINFGSTYLYLNDLESARALFHDAEQSVLPLTKISILDDSIHIVPLSSEPTKEQKKARRRALDTYANAQSWLSTVNEIQSNIEVALGQRRRAEQVYEFLSNLVGDERDWVVYRQVLGARLANARLLIAHGDDEQIESYLSELRIEVQKLIKNDPENVHWKRFSELVEDLASSHID